MFTLRANLTARGAGCLLETLASHRAADTARIEMWSSYAELRKKAGSKNIPHEGVLAVNAKPQLRIVGVVGAGLHADASVR